MLLEEDKPGAQRRGDRLQTMIETYGITDVVAATAHTPVFSFAYQRNLFDMKHQVDREQYKIEREGNAELSPYALESQIQGNYFLKHKDPSPTSKMSAHQSNCKDETAYTIHYNDDGKLVVTLNGFFQNRYMVNWNGNEYTTELTRSREILVVREGSLMQVSEFEYKTPEGIWQLDETKSTKNHLHWKFNNTNAQQKERTMVWERHHKSCLPSDQKYRIDNHRNIKNYPESDRDAFFYLTEYLNIMTIEKAEKFYFHVHRALTTKSLYDNPKNKKKLAAYAFFISADGQKFLFKRAVKHNMPHLLKYLFKAFDSFPEPIAEAAFKDRRTGKMNIIPFRFENCVDAKDDFIMIDSLLPLHYAVRNQQVEIVRLLIEKGASTTEPNNDKMSPLHVACEIGNTTIVELLLKHGDARAVNQTAGYGARNTPLWFAINGKHSGVVELLLEHKASPGLLDQYKHLLNRAAELKDNATLDLLTVWKRKSKKSKSRK